MTLTVPRAGTDAGRAARPVFEEPQTGNVIQAFGDQVAQIGDRLETDRLDREMRRLQVDMTKDLNDLRLQAEEIGDPDELGQFWDQGVAGLKDRYLTGKRENGRAIVDPKNAEAWGLGFDDLANRHGFAIGQTALALRQSQRVGTFLDYEQVAGQQAALTDPNTRDELYLDYDAQVDDMVNRGVFSPEVGAAKKRDFRAASETANLTYLIAEDPDAVLDGLEAGVWSGLDAQQVASWTAKAETAIAAREEKAQKAAEAEAGQVSAQIKGNLNEAIAIVGKGRVSPLEALVDDPVAQEEHPELVAELRGAVALRDEKIFIDQMTPDELEALSDRMAGETVMRKWQTEAKDTVDARLAEAKTELARDPIAYSAKVELPVPPLDLSSPDAMVEGLGARAVFGNWLTKRGYTERPVYLSLDEQAALKAMIDPKGNTAPADRARIARVLATTLGPGAVAGLAPDLPFVHVAGFLGAGGNDALATEILRGQEEIARKTVVMPPLSDRAAPFFSTVGGLFDELPKTGVRAKETLFATADALYAARNGLDPDGEIDAEAYAQATHEAMGGTGSFGSSDATGGIQDINGHTTFMPMGLSQSRVERALDSLGDALGDVPVLGGKEKPRYTAATGAIAAASESGNLPVINGQYLTAEDLQDLQFIAVGDDSYVLARREGNTLVRALDAVTGDEFRLSLTRLTDAAERSRKVLGAPIVNPSEFAP